VVEKLAAATPPGPDTTVAQWATRWLGAVGGRPSIGCRSGGAFALDVGDFDPTTKTVTLTRTFSPRYGLGPSRSTHSARAIRIPDAALTVEKRIAL
jgi:hypothetical protein